MQRISFKGMECPIAHGLEQVGEWWSMLILRDAFDGFTRFDEFERNLGIAPNMLTRRLKALVAGGLLERRLYFEHPPRHEYLLTARGREFIPVLVMLNAWESRHLSPEERTLALIDKTTGHPIEPILVDRATGRPLEDLDIAFAPGPRASDRMRGRFDRVRRSGT